MMTASHERMIAPSVARPKLRPLALPTEHGGWGILFEPLVLALIVAPSAGGAFIALAFVAGFLARQPLRLALQDLMRGKSYPRTRWCRAFTLAYASIALAALVAAIAVSGTTMLVPLAIVAPLGIVQLIYDANNRSRLLLPEIGGAIAMSSSAAAIALAAGKPHALAYLLSMLIALRSLTAIVYVRTLIQRSHGQAAPAWPAIAAHALAVAVTFVTGSWLTLVAMALLLGRAALQFLRPVPAAQTIGWTEIVWGTVTVVLLATAQLAAF